MTNPLPIILGAAALALLAGGKKGRKTKADIGPCPTHINFDFSKVDPKIVLDQAIKESERGEVDIMELTEYILNQQIPSHCLSDPNTMVTIRSNGESATVSAPVLHVVTGILASDQLHEHNYIDDKTYDVYISNLAKYWNNIYPGTPLPKI